MNQWLRFGELLAFVTLAVGLLSLAAYMVYLDRMGEAFGTVLTTLPLIVQAIRNIGAAQAMGAMAEALAQSQPVPTTPQQVEVVNKPGDPVPVDTQEAKS